MCTWIINKSPYPSRILKESKIFSENIYLIDHFSGKEPFLLNGNKSNQFFFAANATLDSNMASELYLFIKTGKASQAFIDFIRYVTEKRWDVSLDFYYLESFYKNNINDFREYAGKYTEAYLDLLLMDEDFFLKENKVRRTKSISQINHYLNGMTLEEKAKSRVQNFIDSQSGKILNIDIIQILIIKMVLIKHFEEPNASKDNKIEKFDIFMQNNFGKIFGREYCLACQYFCNATGKLLGIQRNTSYENAINNIRSTCWDLFLLRIHELFLKGPDENNIFDLIYVVTKEKQLFEFSKLFEYESITFIDNIPIPNFSFSTKESFEYEQIKINDELRYKGDIKLLLDSMKKTLEFYLEK